MTQKFFDEFDIIFKNKSQHEIDTANKITMSFIQYTKIKLPDSFQIEKSIMLYKAILYIIKNLPCDSMDKCKNYYHVLLKGLLYGGVITIEDWRNLHNIAYDESYQQFNKELTQNTLKDKNTEDNYIDTPSLKK